MIQRSFGRTQSGTLIALLAMLDDSGGVQMATLVLDRLDSTIRGVSSTLRRAGIVCTVSVYTILVAHLDALSVSCKSLCLILGAC